MPCPRCRATLPPDARFCAVCGAPVFAAVSPTPGNDSLLPTTPRTPSPAPSQAWSPTSGRTPTVPSEFVAGTLVADRYRIVGTVGRGGMGEVFRADDLKLQQPVALKFLPKGLETDPARLDRLFAEVRLARQISHSAVCRVFDIGEFAGRHFLSMEYIDGENLGSLLRRVGRVPKERAIEMARQLCAGLAAAHEKGILHRDLKPQNVLVDGKGQVRIVDFGLAAMAEAIGGDEVRSGTPAYMAPEQVSGKEVSVRTDLYSLGLVLYELFTGKKAISGKTLAEVTRAHDEQLVENPSQIVSDMDPAVERAILRCLEKDPSMRPRSALAVAAALPGGDPVAAALAAGETPSPEMVASLGRDQVMPPWLAWTCLTAVAIVLLVLPRLYPVGRLVNLVPPVKPPAVLVERSQEILGRFAGTAVAADRASGFSVDHDYYLAALLGSTPTNRSWSKLHTGDPPVLLFYYRQGSRPLVSKSPNGKVFWREPPPFEAGMSGVRLDATGRLVSFYNVPPQLETREPIGAPVDWKPLFEEARLDIKAFKPVDPRWTPPFYADDRAAWEGHFQSDPDTPLRVEAASYQGRPIWFHLVSPWSRPDRQEAWSLGTMQRIGISVSIVFSVCLVAAGIVMARRNLVLGRGDRRGAGRIAGYVFLLTMLSWLISAHHVASQPGEVGLVLNGLGSALVLSALLGVFYLALEPYVRRLWPRVLTSWTRLLSGGLSDPVVGQDLLIGTAVGAVTSVLIWVEVGIFKSLGMVIPPSEKWVDAFQGLWSVLELFIDQQLIAILVGLVLLLLLVMLRLMLKRELLAAAVFIPLYAIPQMLGSPMSPKASVFIYSALGVGLCYLFLRFGLLAATVTVWVTDILLSTQWVTDFTSWTAAPSLWAMAVVSAVAVYGFWASRHGRPTAVF
jgi:predicted Ser/Thr protein kinase